MVARTTQRAIYSPGLAGPSTINNLGVTYFKPPVNIFFKMLLVFPLGWITCYFTCTSSQSIMVRKTSVCSGSLWIS